MTDNDMREIISNNLKRILEEYNITQNKLSKIAGVSESTVGKWILKKSAPRMGAIQRIADHFDLPKSYILEEKKEIFNIHPLRGESIRIPILGTIACGDPILAEENIEGYRYLPVDQVPSGELFSLTTKGKSMEPTIPEGSEVLIRQQSDVESGEIAAVLVNGDLEATLKRVKKQKDRIVLMPDNNEFDPIFVDEEHPARILGKAVSYTHDL
ncbi:repressor LexA [Thalassobacillus cyri]|uniref:Repressor LexA n=1 Tax=Thalassobacillus cyri TaxID=571932 RepID=A0A1H4H3T2_9BACI|nr:XRE family transcriptional regulator [Thalassobacillus cyri]SEB16020.1 repressor LexA [Thalassobacillus cyri]